MLYPHTLVVCYVHVCMSSIYLTSTSALNVLVKETVSTKHWWHFEFFLINYTNPKGIKMFDPLFNLLKCVCKRTCCDGVKSKFVLVLRSFMKWILLPGVC